MRKRLRLAKKISNSFTRIPALLIVPALATRAGLTRGAKTRDADQC